VLTSFSTLPQSNATVTLIAGGGFSEDYGVPDGADVERWRGARRCYVDESLVTTVVGEDVNEVTRTRLILAPEPGRQVKRGDKVTYRYNGEVSTRKVRDVAMHSVSGEVTLALEDA
jgi:hypothetical protein